MEFLRLGARVLIVLMAAEYARQLYWRQTLWKPFAQNSSITRVGGSNSKVSTNAVCHCSIIYRFTVFI